jgi:hypothetical protein
VLRDLARNFFETFQENDLEKLVNLWSAKSPELATFTSSTKQRFAETGTIQLKNLDVRRVTVEGAESVVRVTVEMHATDLKSGQPATGWTVFPDVLSVRTSLQNTMTVESACQSGIGVRRMRAIDGARPARRRSGRSRSGGAGAAFDSMRHAAWVGRRVGGGICAVKGASRTKKGTRARDREPLVTGVATVALRCSAL